MRQMQLDSLQLSQLRLVPAQSRDMNKDPIQDEEEGSSNKDCRGHFGVRKIFTKRWSLSLT
jgi:hypothetical protein